MKGKARRLLSWVCVLALCMSLLPVTALATTGSGTQKDPVTNTENQVTVNKWVSTDEDGNYRLNMEAYASNVVTTESKTTPLDIVLVLDQSGSMADTFSGNQTRQAAMKTAVKNFIDSVAKQYSDESNHQMAIVTFDNNASALADWTAVNSQGKNGLESAIDNLSSRPEGATNVAAGMEEAQDLLEDKTGNNDRQQVVIVFTDGVPTTSNEFNTSVANQALTIAKGLKDDGVSIYTIGIFAGANPSELYGASGFDTNSDGTVNSSWKIDEWGFFPGTDFPEADRPAANRFLNYLSSNYSDAAEIGLRRDTEGLGILHSAITYTITRNFTYSNDGYYLTAENSEGLNVVFQKIFDEINSLQVYPDATALLTDTLSQYFNFPSDLAEGNVEEGSDVTAQYVPVESIDGDNITWCTAEKLPDGTNLEVTVEGDTINIKGFDYVKNAVTQKEDGITGGKLVVSFPIELDAAACVADTSITNGQYPTNSIEEDSRAGLEYKENKDAEANNASTLLDKSPTVYYDKESYDANGTDVTVQVYVDGNLAANPYAYVDLSRSSGNPDYTYWEETLDSSGTITCDFDYYPGENGYDCVDIDVELTEGASKYVLQGITYHQSVGSGTPKDVTSSENTYTVDNVTGVYKAGEPDSGVDVKIYLRTAYTVTYNGENAPADNNTYILQKDVADDASDNVPTVKANSTRNWSDSTLLTEISMKQVPTAAEGSINSGWYTDSDCTGAEYNLENNPDGVSVQTVSDTANEDNVINFYYTSTAEKYTVTWMNGETELERDEDVAYGTAPSYNGNEPTKESTSEFTYTFAGWSTDPNATSGLTEEALPKVTDNVTYYAIFTPTPQQYTITIHYVDDSTPNVVLRESHADTYSWGADYNYILSDDANGVVPRFIEQDGVTYAYDGLEAGDSLQGKVTGNMEITVIYSKDMIGTDDPEKPDGIPDKYQVTILYQSENTEKGTVGELTKEVKTILVDNEWATSGTVTATGSTATAAEGYFFNKWTKAVNDDAAENTDLLAETGSIDLDTVKGGDVITFTAYFTEENPEVNITKELTSVTRDRQQIGDLKAYTAQVGDQLIYTITVTNNGNITLETVTVEDKFTGSGTLTFSNAENVAVDGNTLTISNLSNEEGSNSVSIKATYIVQPDDISKDTIVNTANAYIGGKDEDPDGTDEETVRMDDYTVTITPADITIYTGGEDYSGVVDENGNLIGSTETNTGLPEPGYHITLPAAVTEWLNDKEGGEGSTGEDAARNLEKYMTFTYNVSGTIREWGMKYQGVYSTNSDGEVTQYVYSLTAGKTETEEEIPVRLQFKNGDQVMTSDDFDMSATQVHQTYDMTIYSGELNQGQIKAKLTVGEEGTEQSISCDIKIGSGELTIRSVVDKAENTNAIAADENAVTDTETATAVPNGDVDYYVNDSKVEVKNEGDRVQLLVDQVSDNTDFNAAMGNDAVAKVNAALEEGNTLSNAAYDLAYMDLVDTQNGNTVVTMGDNQSLFIYWPVPEDAAEDSEFHVVHYYELDRENTVDADKLSVQDADVKTGEGIVDKVTIGDGDQEYVKFTTDSFSPFALVYEKAPDPVAKLEVTKTLTKVNGQPYTGGSVSVNDTLTYTITVKNGEVALKDVTITDTFTGKGDLNFRLPDGATVSENQDGTYTITLGNLTAGQEVTITATYKVLRADASSNLINAVKVNGTNPGGGEDPTDEDKTPETPVNPYRPPIRPPEDPDKPELNTEDHYAYIVGYEDGSVQPEGDITRAEVATIFFRLLTDESRNEYWSQTNPYSDVSADDWFNNAVSTLTNAGVLDGYEDGTFKPNGNITRAEFATITARFFEATYEGENLFPDIAGHWAQDYINEAANAGIVDGYEDGTFRPQQYITRAEAVTMVNRTIERHPDADHLLDDMITWPDNPETAWYYEQIQEATNSHEYTMNTDDEQNPYEIWTKLLPNRDWSELEKEWSDANDGAGSGEVV